jgi:3-hydroxybutyryl-CoA dehydrogenase
MNIIVSCTEAQQEELTANGLLPGAAVIYVRDSTELGAHSVDACLDLQFENKPGQVELLEKLPVRLIMVDSVVPTLDQIHPSFVRINAWPTFLSSSLVEASCFDNEKKMWAEEALSLFNKKIEWVPDEPGFITPRIICMIINEAFFALSEGVSTKEEMDTAMKLGTNYPYGPFEWAQKIGLENIATLLTTLNKHQKRYELSKLLLAELANSKVHDFTS